MSMTGELTMQNNIFNKKNILVTGACGTIGAELVRQLLENYQPQEVLCVDNNETELFFIEQRFGHYPAAQFLLCDIKNCDQMQSRMEGIHLIFHTAAFKHVILCERSPYEAVQNNIIGLQALLQSAVSAGVERFIFTSSDKAVNPTNVMGTTKLMGERLVTAANAAQRKRKTIFASTRFGNVLGSRGSVVPIFLEQIRRGGPVTLTDPRMTRFIMSIGSAVKLVLDSASLAQGGEVFITKMPVVRIQDVAQSLITVFAPQCGYDPTSIELRIIGNKPGEKLYEELMTSEETRRAIELKDYFVLLPAFRSEYASINYKYPSILSSTVTNPYNSSIEPAMPSDAIVPFLQQHGLLNV